MFEAVLGLVVGGAMARYLLWPLEMHLARRRVAHLSSHVDQLQRQLRREDLP